MGFVVDRMALGRLPLSILVSIATHSFHYPLQIIITIYLSSMAGTKGYQMAAVVVTKKWMIMTTTTTTTTTSRPLRPGTNISAALLLSV
jgi:hypothetical protein